MSLGHPAAEAHQARFVELRHRYANALQLAARLHAVHHLHFALDAVGIEAPQPARAFLEALCHHLAVAYLADAGVRCEVDADDARLAAGTCCLLGFAVHELVVNAAKQAFPGRNDGQVVIRLRAFDGGWWRCSVEEDGVGFSAATRGDLAPGDLALGGAGPGGTLVVEFARRMGGHSTWQVCASGFAVHLTFPGRTTDVPARGTVWS